MKLDMPSQDPGSSSLLPDSSTETRRLSATPGRNAARFNAEPTPGLTKDAKEPTPAPTPNIPAAEAPAHAGLLPLPVPAAAAEPGAAGCQRVLEQQFSAFGSIGQFRDAQRMATMLAHSSIVPEAFRGEEHLGDCVIALEIANRTGASILAVMQNLHWVQGKPGWSSQFLISCVNASKQFTPIRYEMTGTPGEDSWGCIAWAIDQSGERLKSPEVTIKMAKEEGWYYQPGSKWKTMPELMLCYRSATLFTRLYAPEITMGIQTTAEMAELGPEGNGQRNRPIFEPGPGQPKGSPRSGPKPKDQVEDPLRSPGSVPKVSAAPAPDSAAGHAPAGPPAAVTTANPGTGAYNYLKALTGLIRLSGHSEDNVLRFLRNTRRCDESLASLAEVAEKQSGAVVWAHDNWSRVDRELNRHNRDQRP